ncbi:biotin--[acetyl-CoA-carboxylase] ligase [Cellulomonas fimi]|uniref:biotin--[biotin carboxyl-carrier protein] ligase n=1 Tax=Cellulomonas fimi (strain ATCC 484 / DSM 20113 / JCM 1341 / CCUG 24087 / LMG 16345 / NBRC 15513 / NCIMB 8980 / NCTC 7547 / NRS-133) TaxID=590998 RepID=F4H800_CELFA|nr:biotin--[acetyl-CoA-carboxylase] ligase [Cellulomonas fimi]AEE46961.1 biotin/acetyl-CoA-carboxylase ligase [Cellulomonas fimi ATCC 484]NNH08212.1 biotin--[acetyl-CoA-carboxylase] ligase [Cellulomonas fimi]VEH34698.1 Bifunctional protein BirA [Cellulomonas fimi]
MTRPAVPSPATPADGPGRTGPDAGERRPLDADALRSLLLLPAGPLARVDVVARTGSTNADAVAAVRADPDAWPHGSVLVADHQDAGRGRAGRGWETPPRTALTCSFVARPRVPARTLGWLPLLAGLGAVTAVRATAGVPAVLKWPNDVLVPADTEVPGWGAARKIGGILTEVVPTPPGTDPAVVVGIGLNVAQTADELPVPHATSLALAGAHHVARETLLVALVTALDDVAARWRDADGDAHASGLADEVAAVCATLGSAVRVELPGGEEVVGVAEGLDADGGLVVATADGRPHHVLAGDVRHVRTGP